MRASEFDFHLPEGFIALKPAPRRDASRLLVLGKNGKTEHKSFRDIGAFFKKGDLLILNDTKVLPFRLEGVKPTGGRLEVLLVKRLNGDSPGRWEVLSKGGYTGSLMVSDELDLELEDGKTAVLHCKGNVMRAISRAGLMPLPPYIKRKPEPSDRRRYQTVYASREGSIAAPTAGLHFTKKLLEKIKGLGVTVRTLTLHVGKGTFSPIKCDHIEGHRMEPEWFEMESGLVSEISGTKTSGGRVFAVGTTATRALEGFFSGRFDAVHGGGPGVIRGATDIFIYPGYGFKAIDSLITNFHLPRSTPLMLASALAGRENLLGAYREAIALDYRFFSYGDAMLIVEYI